MLKRELGLAGAVMMGLGSIIGTGVFVSIGIAAGVTGASVVLAIAVAAFVATFNALSSAQLAANHPVSGGTYEYGYRYLSPVFGFMAGWFFILAKSASAATAALGFAGYFLNLLNEENRDLLVPLGLVAVIALTGIVLAGIRRSNEVNITIVSITLFALLFFAITGMPSFDAGNLSPFFENTPGFLEASALMFVAYTGYGRIATLGEEVRDPQRIIPRAIIVTLIVTMALYIVVALIAVGTVGAGALSDAADTTAAPLEAAATSFEIAATQPIVAIGAVTAMLGVLLNLILGLSRVLLAMGRRRDMPASVARLNAAETTPFIAVMVVGIIIGGLVLIGNVKTTWSFSAFNVLLYYSITNLAALRLTPDERLYPRWISVAGLIGCVFLAFWVESSIWLVAVGLAVLGLGWHVLSRRRID
ncbi:MAG: amino acid permease [Chloroflexi bacterium]|nr:amino acid permease [Chloroflexota bacterium]